MANLDTRNKRSSGLHVTLPWRGLFPLPDGTVSAADRQHADGQYSGIAAAAAQQATILGDLTTLFSGYVDDLHDTALVASDSDTLVANDLATVIASSLIGGESDDHNTMYAIYISSLP